MYQLQQDDFFDPYNKVFDFKVNKDHVDKAIALTFKASDGMASLKKALRLKFVKNRKKVMKKKSAIFVPTNSTEEAEEEV